MDARPAPAPPVCSSTASAPHLPVFAAVLAILSWASAYPVVKMALHVLPPIPLAAARYALAAIIVLVWCVYTRPMLPRMRDLPRFIVCGAVGIALYNILFNVGEQTVSAGAAGLLISFSPLIAAIIAVVAMGERLSVWGWVGSLVSFCGVVLVAQGQPGGLTFGSGAADVLAAAFAAAVYNSVQKKLVVVYGALTTTAYVLMVGAVLLTPWLGQAVQDLRAGPVSGWGLVAQLAVFPAILGYGAWAYVVGRIGVARSSGLLYLLSPTTLLLAFLITAEIPSLLTLVGGAIIIAGVGLMNTRGRVRQR
ncbi:EamA family transporter [Acetobacter farinalis]|uniref:EamA family transporter n=1 Tax=Acetobacter farinalis TaxID=1260984 RepID=A0ABT3Q5R4_9PROT|nr:EamA family transporter [Acetobacter farinalis]MCX2560628.1 EamA family transporter [Acetobacter farinalis]NHO29230.1 EamA family transporter [Acetobacter farinalis]